MDGEITVHAGGDIVVTGPVTTGTTGGNISLNALGEIAAKGTSQYMKGDFTFLELLGGHWLIQSNYPEVESAIIKHLLKNTIKSNNT